MAKKETNASEQELTPEGTPEASADKPEPEGPTVEELQKQLADMEANYKAVQRNLASAQQQGQTSAQLLEQLRTIEENQALTLDYWEAQRQGDVVETPVKGPSRLDQLKAQRAEQDRMKQGVASIGQQVEQMVKEAGIDPNSPELESTRQAFRAGQFDRVIPEANKAIANAVKEKGEKTEQEIQAKAEMLAAKELQDRGLLEVETGGPTAAPSGSDSELRAKYAAGEITTETYSKECKDRGIKP